MFSTIENLEKSNGRSKEENLKTSRDYVQLKGLQMKHAKLEQKKHELEHHLDQRQQVSICIICYLCIGEGGWYLIDNIIVKTIFL